MYGNQPMNFNQNFMNPNMMQPSTDERLWVANRAAAECHLMAPASFVRLWDSSCNRYYEKTTDYNGRQSPLRVFEYNEITEENGNNSSNPYVSKEEFLKLQQQVDDFIKSFDEEE